MTFSEAEQKLNPIITISGCIVTSNTNAAGKISDFTCHVCGRAMLLIMTEGAFKKNQAAPGWSAACKGCEIEV